MSLRVFLSYYFNYVIKAILSFACNGLSSQGRFRIGGSIFLTWNWLIATFRISFGFSRCFCFDLLGLGWNQSCDFNLKVQSVQLCEFDWINIYFINLLFLNYFQIPKSLNSWFRFRINPKSEIKIPTFQISHYQRRLWSLSG